jgi:CDP-glucose 4,6-dehydratase
MLQQPDARFWARKRVFVTGHTGFKGAWICAWLDRLGAQVGGFALAPDGSPNLCEEAGTERLVEGVRGDIRDLGALTRAMVGFAPEIVLHLAAQALVRRSYAAPVETFATNVMGTVNLLEAARVCGSVRAVVVVTSDKCYANQDSGVPFAEDAALGGHDPYSASKACAELVAASWRASFPGGAMATARAGNVIGGGDWAADRLVPDCVRALQARRALSLRNPAATRPWQHVLEPLCGYLLLVQRLFRDGGSAAEAWNFGPAAHDALAVSQVVERLGAAWGGGPAWVATPGVHPHEAGRLVLDAGKARARLGWRPRLGLEEALAWTADWYQRHHAGEAAAALIGEQIAAYEDLAGV